MKKWILLAAPLVLVTATAHADHGKGHHTKRHHSQAVAAALPDSVMLEGKEYKVCKPGMQDDCVQARQAGLGFGNRPTNTYHAHKMVKHP
jgi:hypothetical protein